MTEDEIRNMPAGREMDAHIHQIVMGKRVTWNVLNLSGGVDRFNAEYPLPDYSTEIAAAWEVVEHLEQHPDEILFGLVRAGSTMQTLKWRCTFRACRGRQNDAYIEEDTAPLCHLQGGVNCENGSESTLT